MDHAVTDDYFSFMSDKSNKSGSKSVPQEPRVVVPPVKAIVRADTLERVQPSHMEVTESDLSDTVIERIFRRPSP
jgi:hypothetical protein